MRQRKIALLVLFSLVFFVPMALRFTLTQEDYKKLEQRENRTFEEMPNLSFDINVINFFGNKFSAYFNDHFYGRQQVQSGYMNFIFSVFGHSGKYRRVVMSKSGWIFYNEGRDLFRWSGLLPVDTTKCNVFVENTKRKADWLKSRGIKYYMVTPPDKGMVYPEKLPNPFNSMVDGNSKSELKYVLGKLKDYPNLVLIDLYQTMIDAKKKAESIYLSGDTHWSRMGAFYAYQVIIDGIREDFPEVKVPFELTDVKVTNRYAPGDLNKMSGMFDGDFKQFYYDIALPKSVQEPSDVKIQHLEKTPLLFPSEMFESDYANNNLKILIVHDSYSETFKKWISCHFKKSYYVWTTNFPNSEIDEYQPDIFMEEVVERSVSLLINNKKPPRLR